MQALASAEVASATGAQSQSADETGDRSAWDGRAAASLYPVETPSARAERATLDLQTLPPRPHPTAPALQIGHQILRAATHRVDRMLVQLEPAALGRVEVRLDFGHEGRVSAVIATDRPETLEILQRDARSLERGLEQAGLRLDSGGLSFTLRRDSGHGQSSAELLWSDLTGEARLEQPDADRQSRNAAAPAIATLRLLDLQV